MKLFPNAGEIDTNGFLLLQGDIEILSGYQQSLEILSAGSSGLWFGDEQLFCSTQREISAKAHSPCIIAIFTRSHFKVFHYLYYNIVTLLAVMCQRWGHGGVMPLHCLLSVVKSWSCSRKFSMNWGV